MYNRSIPKLEYSAFNSLKKYQSDYLKTNGFFSTDIFSISNNMSTNQLRIAYVIAERTTFAIFLQAVLDDDIDMVKKCLDVEPELIIGEPEQDLVIESKLTWQKFYAEQALTMAVKRKQIKMIELLLSYYDRLEQNENFNAEDIIKNKIKSLSAWKDYEIQNNLNDKDILVPKAYTDYAQSLTDIFKEETFPNGEKGKLSDQTELALTSLFNILLPQKAIKLDDYLDPELFLHALLKTYFNDFLLFKNWEQRGRFCVRVMGLVESVLSPEVAKIFCQGLSDIIRRRNEKSPSSRLEEIRKSIVAGSKENRALMERMVASLEKMAAHHEQTRPEREKALKAKLELFKLTGDQFYYPANHRSRTGIGYEFYCFQVSYGSKNGLAKQRGELDFYWKAYIECKQQDFEKIRNNINDQANQLQIKRNLAV